MEFALLFCKGGRMSQRYSAAAPFPAFMCPSFPHFLAEVPWSNIISTPLQTINYHILFCLQFYSPRKSVVLIKPSYLHTHACTWAAEHDERKLWKHALWSSFIFMTININWPSVLPNNAQHFPKHWVSYSHSASFTSLPLSSILEHLFRDRLTQRTVFIQAKSMTILLFVSIRKQKQSEETYTLSWHQICKSAFFWTWTLCSLLLGGWTLYTSKNSSSMCALDSRTSCLFEHLLLRLFPLLPVLSNFSFQNASFSSVYKDTMVSLIRSKIKFILILNLLVPPMSLFSFQQSSLKELSTLLVSTSSILF